VIVSKLYKKHRTTLTECDMTIAPQVYKESAELNTVYILKIDNEDISYHVNLSKLFLETPVVNIITWDDIIPILTPAMVQAYSIPIPNLTHPQKAVVTTNPLNHPDFLLEYTDINTPDRRNVRTFIDILPDLAITKIGDATPIDLNQSIVSINGLISRPVIFETDGTLEYFVPHGKTFMNSARVNRHPTVQLLDFSGVGGITIVPLSDCQHIFRNKKNVPDATTDLEILLPEGFDLSEYSVFTVLAHSIFFPNQTVIKSKRSIILPLSKLRLQLSLIKQAVCSDEFIEHTYLSKAACTSLEYVSSVMWDSTHSGAFLILVKSNSLWIDEIPSQRYIHNTDRTLYQHYIPFDLQTQSFLDYTYIPYDTTNWNYLSRIMDVKGIDLVSQDQAQIVAEEFRCDHIENIQDFSNRQPKYIRILEL